jgi:adenylate cyclase
MKRILVTLLLLLPCLSFAQVYTFPVISKDSVLESDSVTEYYDFGRKWLFHYGDDTAMANPGYNDNGWDTVFSDLKYVIDAKRSKDTFNSIGWFRYHFIADTSIVCTPLALKVSQYGASEIYLDGKKLVSYGTIAGKNTVGYDPDYVPAVFFITSPGHHVLAVRYANYNAKLYAERNRKFLAGFWVALYTAKSAVKTEHQQALVASFICAIMFGFFMAFCMAHLFLYFFYRASISNLYFSIFCLCLGALFIVAFSNRFSTNPNTVMWNSYILFIILAVGNVSFSGFTNSLFSSKKLRFRIAAALSILAPVIMLFNGLIGFMLSFSMLVFVFIEATIITISAIIKKVKGARIIGAGILFLALFTLSNIVWGSLPGKHEMTDDTLVGKIYMILAVCAIISMPVFMSLYLAWHYAYINRNLKNQLQRVETLSKQAIEQQLEKKKMLEGQKVALEQEVAARTTEVVTQKEKIEKQHEELKTEKKKSDDLLLNILPAEVAEELKEKGHSQARLFNDVTVLFTDFVDFTNAGERMSPDELVSELHTCFKTFDEVISKHSIEKIKTIGDAYLAVCGLPEPTKDHAEKVASAALEIIQFMAERRQQLGNKTFEVRVGIHSGSVVAGIVGVKKFAYDIWGDTVNTAARLEQSSEPGKINISQTTYNLIESKFACTYRGKIQAKNKGDLSMYFIDKIIAQ